MVTEEKVDRRKDWEEKNLPVAVSPQIRPIYGIVVLTIIGLILTTLLNLLFPLGTILFAFVAMLIIGISILSCLYVYLLALSLKVHLEPGRIRTVKEKRKDIDGHKGVQQLPSKLIIQRGVFRKRRTIFTVDEFDRVEIIQSFFGRLNNYGTIKLEEVDKLTDTRDLSIRYIKNPDKYAELLEELIETSNKEIMPG